MRAMTILSLKMLFFTTLTGLFVCVCPALLFSNSSMPLDQSIFLGFFYGTVMTGILVPIHWFGTKCLRPNTAEIRYGLQQKAEILVVGAFNEVFSNCCGLSAPLRVRTFTADEATGKIIISTKMSWKSCGETIALSFSKVNENTVKIEISSKPLLRTTLVDYGKNIENTRLVVSWIKEKNKTSADSCNLQLRSS